MKFIKHKFIWAYLLAAVVSCVVLIRLAQADIPCALPICVGTPVATGNVVNEIYYRTNTDKISVGATITKIGEFFGLLAPNNYCKVFDNGEAKCWGFNEYGQLGQGDIVDRLGDAYNVPAVLPAIDLGTGRTAKLVEASSVHSCALLDNGGVKCWGYNNSGQLGLGDKVHRGGELNEMGDNLPTIDFGTGRTVKILAVGYSHNCVLLDNETVKCWGDNSYGQLGLGHNVNHGDGLNEMGDSLPVVDLGTGRSATTISSGEMHTCALLDNGAVKCWGFNDSGQLGQGDLEYRGDDPGEVGDNLQPIDLGAGRTAIAIDAGDYHTCVILDNYDLKCWGDNDYGQLGFDNLNDPLQSHVGDNAGEMGDNLSAVDLGVGRSVTKIDVDGEHTCAQLDNATVKCWGRDIEYNKLRQGDITAIVPIEDIVPFGFRRKVLHSLNNGTTWNETADNEVDYNKEKQFIDQIEYRRHDIANGNNLPEGAEFKKLKSGKVVVYGVKSSRDGTQNYPYFQLYDSSGALITGVMGMPSVNIGDYPVKMAVAQTTGPVLSREYITVMWTRPITTPGHEHKGTVKAQDYYIDDEELSASTIFRPFIQKEGGAYYIVGTGSGTCNCLINLSNTFRNDKPFYVIEDTYALSNGLDVGLVFGVFSGSDARLIFEGYDWDFSNPPGNAPAEIYGGLYTRNYNARAAGWLFEFDTAPLFGTGQRYVEAWVENNRIYTWLNLYGSFPIEYFLPALSSSVAEYKAPRVHGLPSGGYVLVYQIQYNDVSSSYRGTKPIDIFYKVFDANNNEVTIGDGIVWQEPRFTGPNDPNELRKLILASPTYIDGVQNPTFSDDYITESIISLRASDTRIIPRKSITGHELVPQIASLDGDNFVIMFHSVYYQDGLSYNMTGNKMNNVTLMNSFFSVVDNNTRIAHDDGRQWDDCFYGQSVINSCTHSGDYIFDMERMDNGNLLVATRGGAFATTKDKAKYASEFLIIDKEKFDPISTVTVSQSLSGLMTDINLQYKVVNLDTLEEYLSPVKSLIYASNVDGVDGSISYFNGFTNSATLAVTVDMACTSCDVLEISQRTAPLVSGVCGTFSPWQIIGGTSPLDTQRSLNPVDRQCYQYKASATNATLGVANEYVSDNVIKLDRTPPALAVQASTLSVDALTLYLQLTDDVSGISASSYDLNSTGPVLFTGQNISTIVPHGVNRIVIQASDLAGNSTVINHFVTTDLTPPQINIVGVVEGETYSGDVPLIYTLTQELTNIVITVDGIIRSDLNGLSDGLHTLVITGTDISGTLVSRTINFIIDSGAFSFQILSPQNRAYQYNDLNLQYEASKPLTSLVYSLNGGAEQTDTNLSDLNDGSYVLVIIATSTNGDVETRTINFTVEQSIPVLDLISPVNDAVYASNTVALNYASDSTVELQLNGSIIAADTPDLTFTEDGAHTLILTVTHPVSGNVASRVVNFSTDTILPEVTLLSPESRIYTSGSIPVDYISNKTLSNVAYQIDANVVESLEGLTAGNHIFRMTANDNAGRNIDISVSFEVAELAIVNPANNELVISTVLPPSLDFQYQAQGSFSAFTLALDDAPANLLGPSQGPGSVIPVTMVPGNHEITLRGDINFQQLGKRVNFVIGTRNVSVGPDSINYSYTNCEIGVSNCDVTAQLKVKNIGEYNIDEPINVRLDHVDTNGYESFWFTIPSLNSKEDYILTSSVFKASSGDTLTVNIDPNSELTDEVANDNSYSVEFSAGRIVEVNTALASDNVYIEGVSVFNNMRVLTVGVVDKVEYRFNGWVFEDIVADGDFNSIIDMGLMSKDQSCVEIRALDASGATLDARLECFDISALNIAELTRYNYDWASHQSTPNRVTVSDIDKRTMLINIASGRRDTMSAAASIIPVIGFNGGIDYKFYYDPGAMLARPEEQTVQWSNDGFLDGGISLPNGRSVMVSTIDPQRGTCNVDGAVSIKSRDRIQALNERYAEELAAINNNLSLINVLSPDQFQALASLDGANIDFNTLASIPIGSGLLNMISAAGGSSSSLFDENSFLSKLFDINFNVLSWVHGDIPERAGTISLNGEYINRFVGEQCIIVDLPNRVISLNIEGYYDWGVRASSLKLVTEGATIDAMAYAYASWGIPDIPLTDIGYSFHVPLAIVDVNIRLDSININMPIDFGARHAIKIINNDLLEFGPFHARASFSVNHKQRLANISATLYPLIINTSLIGFGGGKEYEAYMDLSGVAKFDFVSASSFSDQFFNRVEYSFVVNVFEREKICFLWVCYHTGWDLDSTPISRPNIGENVPFGRPYTQSDVDAALRSANAPWVQ